MSHLISERRWLAGFAVLTLSIIAASALIAWRTGEAPSGVDLALFLPACGSLAWIFYAVTRYVLKLAAAGVDSPLKQITLAKTLEGAGDYAVRMGPLFLSCIFGIFFEPLKLLVPRFGGFRLDGALARIDHALFLGHDPWRLSHALFGRFTPAIDWWYHGWLVGMIAVPLIVAAFANARLRARFFLSWVLSWTLLGGLGALGLASAGPMFLEALRLPGADHFQGLMAQLAGAPWTLTTRDYLLANYLQHTNLIGAGISAAPSMHVAMVTLYLILALAWSRWLVLPAALFFGIIEVGSIHLGFHYAVDGLMSMAGVGLIWWAVGRWLDAKPAAAPATVEQLVSQAT